MVVKSEITEKSIRLIRVKYFFLKQIVLNMMTRLLIFIKKESLHQLFVTNLREECYILL